MTPPTIGRIVHYRLSREDRERITQQRSGDLLPGNDVYTGDVYPAIVVRVWSDVTVNLQVFLDGPDTLWRTSAQLGGDGADPDNPEGHGCWFWPPRVDMTREGR